MRYWDLFGREGGGRTEKWRTPAGQDAAGVLLFAGGNAADGPRPGKREDRWEGKE